MKLILGTCTEFGALVNVILCLIVFCSWLLLIKKKSIDSISSHFTGLLVVPSLSVIGLDVFYAVDHITNK